MASAMMISGVRQDGDQKTDIRTTGEACSELARSPLGLLLQVPAQVSLAQTAATALSSKSRT